jgi:hypothetical protein
MRHAITSNDMPRPSPTATMTDQSEAKEASRGTVARVESPNPRAHRGDRRRSGTSKARIEGRRSSRSPCSRSRRPRAREYRPPAVATTAARASSEASEQPAPGRRRRSVQRWRRRPPDTSGLGPPGGWRVLEPAGPAISGIRGGFVGRALGLSIRAGLVGNRSALADNGAAVFSGTQDSASIHASATAATWTISLRSASGVPTVSRANRRPS